MHAWQPIVAVVVATGIFVLILFYFIRRFCCHPEQQPQEQPIQRASSLQNGISKLHNQESIYSNKRRTNYYVLRRGISSKPLFNWSDNPSLITDAVENGWSRFAFNNFTSSPSIQSNKSILGYCAPAGDGGGKDVEMVEIGWEVCPGSADFIQKIRINSGLQKIIKTTTSSMAAASVIRSALPLPGPALGNSSPFPQEAYFEITILSIYEDEHRIDINGKVKANKGEEKIKLIQENLAGEKASSESLIHITSNNSNGILKSRSDGKDTVEGKTEMGIVVSLGLAGGGSLPLKLPGSYPGSVGFNSDGSVYLEGVKLMTDSESNEWGTTEKVVGCGYNPNQKKVFFTVDSKLVHEVHCMAEEFETPLYPTLAANTDVTVLVNFGQSVFKYTQANLHRTPNPCFIGPLGSSPVLGYDDSKELFSMGRIDSHWLDRSAKRSVQYYGSVNRGMSDYDESSEGDLFEIVLDNNSRGRSPNTPF
ncbi:uncharacterized protein LOC111876170 [Lactuca sativa]|uniref:SPRY domain-containing protein n=1 Tax=Lactuca sativa TaxID=4236 RepID=A0A9R1WIX1_LACSA|nr:uncharacterized protein LOC111876170 [Lactuca sativa]KAJ0224639.1 hypothetical protein LSAT_V11C100009250 [Lactuca sativa]